MISFHWQYEGSACIGYIVSKNLRNNFGQPRLDEFARIYKMKHSYSDEYYWYGKLTMRGDVPDSSASYKKEYIDKLKEFLEKKHLWERKDIKRGKTIGDDPRYAWMFRGWGYPPSRPLTIEEINAAKAIIPKHSDS